LNNDFQVIKGMVKEPGYGAGLDVIAKINGSCFHYCNLMSNNGWTWRFALQLQECQGQARAVAFW
jgi:hypothetical protein